MFKYGLTFIVEYTFKHTHIHTKYTLQTHVTHFNTVPYSKHNYAHNDTHVHTLNTDYITLGYTCKTPTSSYVTH